MIREKMKGRTPVQRRGGALESIGVPPFKPGGYGAMERATVLGPLVAANGKSLHAIQQFLPGERLSHTGFGVRGKPRLENLTIFARRAIPNAPDSSRELTDHLELVLEPPAEDAHGNMNADRKTRRKRQLVIPSLGEQFCDSFARHRLVFLV
jgi:hypothetical protein